MYTFLKKFDGRDQLCRNFDHCVSKRMKKSISWRNRIHIIIKGLWRKIYENPVSILSNKMTIQWHPFNGICFFHDNTWKNSEISIPRLRFNYFDQNKLRLLVLKITKKYLSQPLIIFNKKILLLLHILYSIFLY